MRISIYIGKEGRKDIVFFFFVIAANCSLCYLCLSTCRLHHKSIQTTASTLSNTPTYLPTLYLTATTTPTSIHSNIGIEANNNDNNALHNHR